MLVYLASLLLPRTMPAPAPAHLYFAFRSLFDMAPDVDEALGTAPMSRPRVKLARKVMYSSRKIRGFAPASPGGVPNRIAREYAIQASQTVQALVYPVLLGSDAELEAFRSTLSVMALQMHAKV